MKRILRLLGLYYLLVATELRLREVEWMFYYERGVPCDIWDFSCGTSKRIDSVVNDKNVVDWPFTTTRWIEEDIWCILAF